MVAEKLREIWKKRTEQEVSEVVYGFQVGNAVFHAKEGDVRFEEFKEREYPLVEKTQKFYLEKRFLPIRLSSWFRYPEVLREKQLIHFEGVAKS